MLPQYTFARGAIGRAALLALLPAALAAQAATGTVSGRVTTSGEAIVAGTVVATGTGRGTQTRGDGSYRLTLTVGRYELRARAVGFASGRDSVTITAGGNATVNFALEKRAATLEAVTTLGTRGEARTVIDAPVPIDVLSALELKQTGRTETAQMIQALAPSVNFPRATIGDGTDHVRPTTLRGLGPDQALVLINGKRRHTSALVNVNGTIGRGSTGVDLNAIPASMIDHIEILRDGAAAQYGSDAIAGVVNIVLKSGTDGQYGSTIGGNVTTYNRDAGDTRYPFPTGERSARDGHVFQAALDKGFSFGQSGFVHLDGELRDRGFTNRSLPDLRQQYFAGDPRNSTATLPVLDKITHRQGDAQTHDLAALINAGTTLSSGVQLYGFGGATRRNGEAAGFFRRALDDRTVRAVYPNGFLPIIASVVDDYAGTVGGKGTAGTWNYDLSTELGRNTFDFRVKDSENAVLGAKSPTEFYAGQLAFDQSTTNLDLFRTLPLFQALRVAAGAEFRADRYQIKPGDPSSYFTDTTARVLDQNGAPTTRRPAPFSQVFPGFSPVQQTKASRNNVAGYLDLEADLSRQFLIGLAGRVERYSDFGSTTTGKVSSRYEPVKGYALRGAVSSGFRAPSLGQSFFQSTATNFVGGVPLEIRTLPVNDPLARLLGARDLKPETSVNYSAGVALEPTTALSVTADYYRIDIKDRIVFSENFVDASGSTTLVTFFKAQGKPEITGARYFTNAINTKTDGVDVITNYGFNFANTGVLRLTAAVNVNQTKLTRVDSIPAQSVSNKLLLFGRIEQTRVEKGQPRDNIILSSNYNLHGFGLNLRTQRYGAVTVAGSAATDTLDQTFRAKWVTDVGTSLLVLGRYTLGIGADNLFDIYPDRNNTPGLPLVGANGLTGNGNVGIFPYNGVSPFGFNGRFIYAKLSAGL